MYARSTGRRPRLATNVNINVTIVTIEVTYSTICTALHRSKNTSLSLAIHFDLEKWNRQKVKAVFNFGIHSTKRLHRLQKGTLFKQKCIPRQQKWDHKVVNNGQDRILESNTRPNWMFHFAHDIDDMETCDASKPVCEYPSFHTTRSNGRCSSPQQSVENVLNICQTFLNSLNDPSEETKKISKNKNSALKIARIFKFKIWRGKVIYLFKCLQSKMY